jgi:hypothetical protein
MSVTETSEVGQLPSERDWNVYQLVRIQQWSTRAAAEEHGISQTRVGQIVRRVGEFIVQSIKVPAKEVVARQLAAGRQLAAERIDFLVGEAMRCFRKSQATVKSAHESAARRCTSTRTTFGDMRYLHAAARLTLIASTLPPPLVLIDADDFEPVTQEATAQESAPAEKSAHETCSTSAIEQPVEAPSSENASSATAVAMMGCVEQSRTEQLPARSAARPVQKRGSGGKEARQAQRREAFFQT